LLEVRITVAGSLPEAVTLTAGPVMDAWREIHSRFRLDKSLAKQPRLAKGTALHLKSIR
jgi:hypothetical protein